MASSTSVAVLSTRVPVDVPLVESPPDPGRWRSSEHHLRGWLITRHALWVEVITMLVVYVAYDAGRGLVGGGRPVALHHALAVAAEERHLHLFVERDLQQATSHVPGLLDLFGLGYATFHLGITALVMLWLHRRRPEHFAAVRTALIAATGVALAGFVLFPTAPPRLAAVGVADTLSLGRATSDSGLLRLLYNPYAAMPSVHIAFAVLAGGSVALFAHSRWWRLAGSMYPVYVAVEVIATGNHFVLDVAGGLATDLLAVFLTIRLLAVPAGALAKRRTPLGIRRPGLIRWPGQPMAWCNRRA